MKIYSLIISVILTIFVLSGCSPKYEKIFKSDDYELKYRKGMEYYEAGKYERAAALFEQSGMFYRGSKQDDTLNFYLAKSYYQSGDIYTAEYYLDQFRTTFPRSPFMEEASILRVKSIYDQTNRYELDQTPTYRTLSAINEFLYLFPNSAFKTDCTEIQDNLNHRLDQKQYESAKLYYKIMNYKAATAALRTTLKDYPDSRYREDILYLLVASAYKYAENSYRHLQKDRYQAVIDEYYNFVSEFPDSKYRKEVEKMNENAMAKVNFDNKEKSTDKTE